MAAKRRTKIPVGIADQILYESDHICCICHTKGKDVQIHHIDKNNSNNKPDNLCIVCLDCHSRITGSRGLGKSYTYGEIRRYKRAWEKQVADSRRIHRPQTKYQGELISHIDVIICEILATKPNNPRIEILIKVLFEIHLWRGTKSIDFKILEGLDHLALMSGLSPSKVAVLVSNLAWEMSWHFVGPDDVSMNKNDVEYVLKCINILNTLSSFNCEFGHGRKAEEAIVGNIENFFEQGLWYSNKKIVNTVIRVYGESLKNCYEKNELKFAYGRTVLRKSVRKLQTLLKEEQKAWNTQRKNLIILLKI